MGVVKLGPGMGHTRGIGYLYMERATDQGFESKRVEGLHKVLLPLESKTNVVCWFQRI